MNNMWDFNLFTVKDMSDKTNCRLAVNWATTVTNNEVKNEQQNSNLMCVSF